MKSRFTFLFTCVIYWILVFAVTRVLFLLYHWHFTIQFPLKDIIGIFSHGFVLDLSATAYVLIFPLVVLILTSFASGKLVSRILRIYMLLMLILVIIVTLVDFEIYKYWGMRLDNTALRFIGKPKEMLASTSWFTATLLFLALIFLTWLFFLPYRKFAERILMKAQKPRWMGLVIFTLLVPVMFVAVRGGTGIAPVSVSRVYFHPDPFPNQAAINVLWNTGHSLLEKKDMPNPYKTMDDQTSKQYLSELFAEDTTAVAMLKTSRPNVILVILESFTAKLIEPLGGLAGVTPQFNKLSGESIFFTNFYANDSRTDKSIVSILSGYPALGKVSIIKFPNKTQKLGILSRELGQAGYRTSFYYGGDIDFANMRSYLVNGRFHDIVEVSDFSSKQQTGRWGVHDQHTFQRLYEECDTASGPFFKVLLTLSNHEPFDIPVKQRFGSKTIDARVSNTAYYTDSCLGDFIQKAKKATWWNNTLIIMTADHGTLFPGKTIVYYPEKYRIPMIWTGGAIQSDTLISTYCSQSDLARTLLDQLGIDASAYPLSKDIFRSRHQFAFYEYSNSYGMVSDSGNYVYDYDQKKVILNHGTVSGYFLRSGQAMQQEVYDVFLRN
jgi:phosphoglycerol transferase MdoB-like AlkP superfamily enzyme